MIYFGLKRQTTSHNRPAIMIAIIGTVLVGSNLASLTIILPRAAQAQGNGPPAGAPGSQLASLTDAWWKWVFSIDTSTQPNPFTSFYQGDCRQDTRLT